MAGGCVWDEEYHGRDWQAVFRAEADVALATGPEGIVAYLLCRFYEEGVEQILREPRHNAELSPEDVARRARLKLWADAIFPRGGLCHSQTNPRLSPSPHAELARRRLIPPADQGLSSRRNATQSARQFRYPDHAIPAPLATGTTHPVAALVGVGAYVHNRNHVRDGDDHDHSDPHP